LPRSRKCGFNLACELHLMQEMRKL
jgi:hypothetical protein